jgi:hypothetical protein
MKITRLLILLALGLLTVTSCRTPAQKAQRLLNRAIAKDPSILTHVMAEVDTTIEHKDTIKVPGDVQLVEVPCDTAALDALLFENDRLKVELIGSTVKNGKLKRQLKVTEKEQSIPIVVQVPVKFKVPVVVPAQTVVVIDRGFFYKSGIAAWVILVLIIAWKLLRAKFVGMKERFFPEKPLW